MANVLVVAALEFSDPMLFVVLMKANDSFLHEPGFRGTALRSSGMTPILFRTGVGG
jgi:hypothetical protein